MKNAQKKIMDIPIQHSSNATVATLHLLYVTGAMSLKRTRICVLGA